MPNPLPVVSRRRVLFGAAALALLGGVAFTGLSLLIAARPQSTEVASGWMNLAMLPMWVLSGIFFSSERFPEAAQPFIKALPLTATNDALRATMLQGAGLGAVAPQIGVIALWLVLTFTLALKLFRWR